MAAPLTDPALKPIQCKVEEGIPLSLEDGLTLFATRDLHGLGRMAREQKERKSGKNVYYILNRYVNSTNVCYAGCKFCSFAVDEFKETDRVVRMAADQVLAKALETGTNFNQIHIVGGHDPRQLSLDYWLPLMRRFKERLPHVQLSLFTAAELDYMAKRHRMKYPELVATLKSAGLDNVNGGGAEIFADPTRQKICPNKVTAGNWLAIHEELHRQGIVSNATMLYGHIESVEDRVDHLIRLRESQRRSPGYNAFIPLAFHPDGNELNDCGWTSGL
ncbi:MAG TPA: radical SAM protein, partial [Candidatus Rubrimentiphilum sp.]|nr:radical SAM protein [Candidatus Rubrimentiphilum sp.]